jgi:hypothetical protein
MSVERPRNLNRKPRHTFTVSEDHTLSGLVTRLGDNDWTTVASQMPGRTPRQCRDRWKCYLSPHVSNDKWTENEDQVLIEEYGRIGPRWSVIAGALKRRSEVAVKNRWKLLYRRTKGSLFAQAEQEQAAPLPEPELGRIMMPALRMPEVSGGPTASQKDLEAFFRSLRMGRSEV